MYVCCVWVYVCANFNQQYLLTTLQKDTFWEMFLSLDLILPSDRWIFLRNEVENGRQQQTENLLSAQHFTKHLSCNHLTIYS